MPQKFSISINFQADSSNFLILILLKTGGRMIYWGPLGQKSIVRDYFLTYIGRRNNKELVKRLSFPPSGSKDLHFPIRFSQNGWGQFKTCFWKQYWSYWRSPSYNLMPSLNMLIASFLYGLLFWDQGKKLDNQQSIFSVFGAMYTAVIVCGINNASSVLPYVTTERSVLYRERFAGMYAPWAYALAQVYIRLSNWHDMLTC
ncbi:PREDICTED: pleiotropic drug resistance protein 3-like [Nicotiana attenuata]|uniref:pleiotropic drug resistance protein 3-like n=1 Tax=Nicotiana attenuata TaxID=49451 RepID=UPI000904D598|nr:PREDICTED: pleiotropic drug resistance protein 3-like [Nicotiana attenuata]